MIRKIIKIDEEKCNGCGICAEACHEGAIGMVDGKAKLLREDYCDGLGDCLPACPTGAITFEEREAAAYDVHHHGGGCPGSAAMAMSRSTESGEAGAPEADAPASPRQASRLEQWPCQIKLVPTKAPFYDGKGLLVAADCAAYAYSNLHEDFMKGKTTVIGCPKLDDVDYTEKLTEIIRDNDIKDLTIVRMEVPCCGGLQMAAQQALQNSGKFIPWQVVTISRDGRVLD